jgi:hypothetical protein
MIAKNNNLTFYFFSPGISYWVQQNKENLHGKKGLGVMNENGERLVELCKGYNLVIRVTLFKHKEKH